MTTATQGLVAITPGGAITTDMIAGYYTWYSIKETMLPLRTVRKAFNDNKLDVSVLPKERRPEHVAQEACRKVERVTTNGHREEIRAEQVLRNKDFLIYQITRHVQDKKKRVIEHPKALRVLFDFQHSSLSFEPLDGSTKRDVQGLIDEIQGHFDAAGTKMPGHKLRTIVRHYVEAAGAENMRGDSGGVYFLAQSTRISANNKLHAHHGDTIDGTAFLQQIRAALKQIYGSVDMHILPCINDEGQREYLKERFIVNCSDDLKAYRNECVELVTSASHRKRGFRSDKRARMVEQRHEMDLRRQRFADILGETLTELDRDMTLADQALTKFLTAADE